MFLLTYHGRPNKKYTGDPVGGAFINCWIESETSKEADKIAKNEIKSLNWDIIERTEVLEVAKDFYESDDPKLQYYEQALIDKTVFVFYNYPPKGVK